VQSERSISGTDKKQRAIKQDPRPQSLKRIFKYAFVSRPELALHTLSPCALSRV